MKRKRMNPLLLLLPLLFLLAVHGQDSRKEEPRVVLIAIDGLRWQEVFEGARRDSVTLNRALKNLDSIAEEVADRYQHLIDRQQNRLVI